LCFSSDFRGDYVDVEVEQDDASRQIAGRLESSNRRRAMYVRPFVASKPVDAALIVANCSPASTSAPSVLFILSVYRDEVRIMLVEDL
jgi:hypothetical protein